MKINALLSAAKYPGQDLGFIPTRICLMQEKIQ